MTAFEILTLLLLAAAVALLIYLSARQTRISERLDSTLRREAANLFSQWQTYHSLCERLDLRRGVPYTKDWSASPDFLELIVEHCLEHKPDTILECSSGVTTLMLAAACRENGKGRVISLENGEPYALKTQRHIERYRLELQASVHHAPLRPVTVNGEAYSWYALDAVPDGAIDMLVIDGPPGYLQKNSRYPALPLLYDKLADGCVVFMDDAARPDEREMVQLWRKAYPGLHYEYLEAERGCAMLKIEKS